MIDKKVTRARKERARGYTNMVVKEKKPPPRNDTIAKKCGFAVGVAVRLKHEPHKKGVIETITKRGVTLKGFTDTYAPAALELDDE